MAFTKLELSNIQPKVERYVQGRRPKPEIRDKLDIGYRIYRQSVELITIRPGYQDPNVITESSVAKTTYVRSQHTWKVYWQRSDFKWHAYDPPQVASLDEFLNLVEIDSWGCFWG